MSVPSIEALENAHRFPGKYIFKVFGAHEQAFVDAARLAISEVAGADGLLTMSSRASSGGKHICVTLNVLVQSAHQVQAIYVELTQIDGIRMIL